MSKWFPDVSELDGAREASKAGVFGALFFAAFIVIGAVMLLATNRSPSMGQEIVAPTAALIGMGAELAFVLFAAWRFKIGKGAFVGAALVLLFFVEVGAKVATGTTNIGWLFAYAAMFVALVNGVRGGWARRNGDPVLAGDLFD